LNQPAGLEFIEARPVGGLHVLARQLGLALFHVLATVTVVQVTRQQLAPMAGSAPARASPPRGRHLAGPGFPSVTTDPQAGVTVQQPAAMSLAAPNQQPTTSPGGTMTTPTPATPFADPAPAQRLERAATALTAHGFTVEILDHAAAARTPHQRSDTRGRQRAHRGQRDPPLVWHR
jgi:hypothetical protein